ncbi:GNAT family N-acetyltransferase [Phenylobacterium sp.]|uniref:GNAT family N-acetyltransferase n=1 Tax=Phenylobacterium sp. TaxID=1871053 RepID=UPI003D2A7A33
MNVDILRIGPGDAAVLERVAEDVFDDAIDPARVAAYLAEPNHLMVLAVSAGEVVGQARGIVHRHPDLPTELYIDNLGVTPARKREGIATRLLDELVRWGRENGCEEAWVGTEPDNEPARALYEARGSEAETFVLYFYAFDDT